MKVNFVLLLLIVTFLVIGRIVDALERRERKQTFLELRRLRREYQ